MELPLTCYFNSAGYGVRGCKEVATFVGEDPRVSLLDGRLCGSRTNPALGCVWIQRRCRISATTANAVIANIRREHAIGPTPDRQRR
jgi:hypothetical protein